MHQDNAGAVQPQRDGALHAGELEIRLGEGLVLAAGIALTLSVREFELLVALAHRVGAIVTREELFGSVWGGDLRPGDRSVDVYVSKLRGKLEQAMPDRRFIHTHPGFGYRFQPQPWQSASSNGTVFPSDTAASTDPATATADSETPATAGVPSPAELSRNVHNERVAQPTD